MIGTAPLRPPHITKRRSPQRNLIGSVSSPTTTGRATKASRTASSRPSSHDPVLVEVAERDRQAEHGEDGDLREAGQRLVEALDLALVRRPNVAEEHSGHEHGEEAGAVRECGHAVEDAGEREREDRIEGLVREVDPPHRLPQHDRAEDAESEADRHLRDELEGDAPERCAVVRRELERADHQRDGDRVVHARLAKERGAGAPADLLAAEHGEHHGRVGGGERRAEDGRKRPAEVERGVCEQRDEQRRAERAEDAEDR